MNDVQQTMRDIQEHLADHSLTIDVFNKHSSRIFHGSWKIVNVTEWTTPEKKHMLGIAYEAEGIAEMPGTPVSFILRCDERDNGLCYFDNRPLDFKLGEPVGVRGDMSMPAWMMRAFLADPPQLKEKVTQ